MDFIKKRTTMHNEIIKIIRKVYQQPEGNIPLHAPVFLGNEKKYLQECIDSTFVSYLGEFVTRFEDIITEQTRSKHAIALSNGTSALQIALIACGVKQDTEVITQPLTFVATANAISHVGASPVFVDVDKSTLGMSPDKLNDFLRNNAIIKSDGCYNKITKKKISACVPVHIFGHPCEIDKVVEVCNNYKISVVEDSAESLGSFFKEKHTGTFGEAGILSFNGNKTITTGGGGIILTDNKDLAHFAKHLSSTAKKPGTWEFIHDEVAFNYRMPNINAAVGLAQMESFKKILDNKRKTAELYKSYFRDIDVQFIEEPKGSNSNYWLNALIFNNSVDKNDFLEISNKNGIMTRPIWQLMNKLEMYSKCQSGDLSNSIWLEERVVNIPSSFNMSIANNT